MDCYCYKSFFKNVKSFDIEKYRTICANCKASRISYEGDDDYFVQ